MKKLYYSIGEVSKLTDVEPHVLRYWESVFPQLNPGKNKSGKRTYMQKHIDTIMELKVLIKDRKYSTAGAKKALSEKKKNPDQHQADAPAIPLDLQRDLKQVRVFLQKLHDQL